MSRLYYPQSRAILQLVFDGFSEDAKDSRPQIIPVLPKEMTLHLNSYRQPDSWEIAFDADDMPIDPILVRAGAVECFMFELSSRDKELKLISRQHTLEALGTPLDEVTSRDRFTFGNEPIVAGLIDDIAFDFTSSGRLVKMSGQDYTAYLMGRQYPPDSKGRARRIPTGIRLDRLVSRLLKEADPQDRLRVKLDNLKEKDMPTVGAGEVRCHKRGIPIKQETNYWEVIYKVCTRYGVIPFVRGLNVHLTRPSGQRGKFEHRIRRFSWGHNISSLELSRKLGKEKVPRVVVKSYDLKGRVTSTVVFPRESSKSTQVKRKRAERARKAKKKPGITETTKDEFQIVPVYGITNTARLREIAENVFTLLGEGERKVNVTTKDLRDHKDNSFLDLRAGDPISVDFVDFNRKLVLDDKISPEEKVAHLVARGYNTAVAEVIAEHYAKLVFLKRPLRVREVTLEFSVASGIEIEVEAVDFVVIDGIRDPSLKKSRKDKREDKIKPKC